MARARDMKMPRVKLPEALANALRMYSYNWRGKRSEDGKLWTIYPYGKRRVPDKVWTLHSDADPALVLDWLARKERGQYAPSQMLLREVKYGQST